MARYLSRYDAKICVVEKEADVCCGTSKANSAIIHSGFNAEYGGMMSQLACDLDIPFIRNGSLVLCLKKEDMPRLLTLYENGIKNGVPDLDIVDGQRLRNRAENWDEAMAALWAPAGGIICPFELTIGLAENAYAYGVKFLLSTKVKKVLAEQNGNWSVMTDKGTLVGKIVVNAAVVYADVFHNMVSSNKIHITPRKGEYILLDHSAGTHVHHTIFQLPNEYGKGVRVSPTVHGNLLVGPTSIDIVDKEAADTTAEGLDKLAQTAAKSVKNFPMKQAITSFAGLRAYEKSHDFIIGEVATHRTLLTVLGLNRLD